MPEGDTRRKFGSGKIFRGSQAIFGERQKLREVLRSLQSARLPRARKQMEIRQLQALIEARTAELNRISPTWDRRYRQALNSESAAKTLLKLVATLAKNDYLLARALAEHPGAPPEILTQLATHPYHAARENVARHPATPIETLRGMAEDSSEPLWFLVACNPATPADLRERLRARMREGAGTS